MGEGGSAMTGIVIYNDYLVPSRFGGFTVFPFIFIRKKYRGDVGLLAHEREHIRQWLRYPVLWWFMYVLSKKWRLRWEVEAYKVQMGFSPNDIGAFARFLSTKYGLDITEAEAMKLLEA
jgi:hypothetical protein